MSSRFSAQGLEIGAIGFLIADQAGGDLHAVGTASRIGAAASNQADGQIRQSNSPHHHLHVTSKPTGAAGWWGSCSFLMTDFAEITSISAPA